MHAEARVEQSRARKLVYYPLETFPVVIGMKVRIPLLAAALCLTLDLPARTQTIVSSGSTLAQQCFVFAKAGTKPRDGVQICNASLKNDPLNARDRAATYGNRGVLLSAMNEVDEAESDFKTAIRLDATLGDPYVNLGSMLIRKKQYHEAIEQINKGLELGMSFPQIGYYDRALAYDYLGRYTEAYADYKKTLEYDPSFKLASDRLKDFIVTRKPGQG